MHRIRQILAWVVFSLVLAQPVDSSFAQGLQRGRQLFHFIVDLSGTAFPVPIGSSSPTAVINRRGAQTGIAFVGHNMILRVMSPVTTGPYQYPLGYIKYDNLNRQGIDPYTGRVLPNSKSHFELRNME